MLCSCYQNEISISAIFLHSTVVHGYGQRTTHVAGKEFERAYNRSVQQSGVCVKAVLVSSLQKYHEYSPIILIQLWCCLAKYLKYCDISPSPTKLSALTLSHTGNVYRGKVNF